MFFQQIVFLNKEMKVFTIYFNINAFCYFSCTVKKDTNIQKNKMIKDASEIECYSGAWLICLLLLCRIYLPLICQNQTRKPSYFFFEKC